MTLQDLVERLAAPHVEEVKVIDRDTGMPDLVRVTRRPLLADLDDAARVSRNRSGGSSGKSIVPLDSDVIRLQETIRGDLTRDLLRLGAVQFRYGTLIDLLLQWHGMFEGAFPNGSETAVWIEQLARWEAAIRAIVEPVKVREVTVPCPICGATEQYVEDERRSMLTLTYSEDAPAETTALTCARCGLLATGAAAAAATLRIEKVTNTKTA